MKPNIFLLFNINHILAVAPVALLYLVIVCMIAASFGVMEVTVFGHKFGKMVTWTSPAPL